MFILKQKLFNKKKYTARCDSCFHGRLSADKESVLCVKNGIMMPGYCCKKYKYDPLKRRPDRPPELHQFKPEDFNL